MSVSSKNRMVLWGCILLGLIVMLIGWRKVSQQHASGTGPVDDPLSAAVTNAASSDREQRAATNRTRAVLDASADLIVPSNTTSFHQELPSVFSLDSPIAFYGKVVDENMAPLPEVTVTFGRLDASPDNYTVTSTLSDSQGLFELTGVKGKSLNISFKKSGYYVVRREQQFNFEYSNPNDELFYRPDTASPVVFQMRKRGTGVELITSHQGIKREVGVSVPRDGTPVFFDFLSRKLESNGHVQIETWKEPAGATGGKNDWRVRLSIPDGGFSEFHDEFAFEAPEGGYESIVEWSFVATQPDWQGRLEKDLYVKFGTPARYGRITIKTSAASEAFYIGYAVNPHGSRNLEPAQGGY